MADQDEEDVGRRSQPWPAIRRSDTPEARAFWASVERTLQEVARWPEWMRHASIAERGDAPSDGSAAGEVPAPPHAPMTDFGALIASEAAGYEIGQPHMFPTHSREQVECTVMESIRNLVLSMATDGWLKRRGDASARTSAVRWQARVPADDLAGLLAKTLAERDALRIERDALLASAYCGICDQTGPAHPHTAEEAQASKEADRHWDEMMKTMRANVETAERSASEADAARRIRQSFQERAVRERDAAEARAEKAETEALSLRYALAEMEKRAQQAERERNLYGSNEAMLRRALAMSEEQREEPAGMLVQERQGTVERAEKAEEEAEKLTDALEDQAQAWKQVVDKLTARAEAAEQRVAGDRGRIASAPIIREVVATRRVRLERLGLVVDAPAPFLVAWERGGVVVAGQWIRATVAADGAGERGRWLVKSGFGSEAVAWCILDTNAMSISRGDTLWLEVDAGPEQR